MQLCNNNFASKLLGKHSTLMAKVTSCINVHFCNTIIMLFLSENERKTEIAILCIDFNVAKYGDRSIAVAISLRNLFLTARGTLHLFNKTQDKAHSPVLAGDQ